MNRLKVLAAAAVAALSLSGCGTPQCFTNTAYVDSKAVAPLRIPSGLAAPDRSGDMAIPGGAPAAGSTRLEEDKCFAAPPPFYATAGQPNPDGLPTRPSEAPAAPARPGPGAGPSAGTSLVSQSVAGFVAAWADAWSSRDFGKWVTFYAPEYAPAGYGSHDEWLEDQKSRFDIPAETSIEPDTLEVTPQSNGDVRARFVQSFGTAPDLRRVVKELVLTPAPQTDGWRIIEERIVDIL